jgi:hypothetical protein
MQKRVLVLTTSAFILAGGLIAANAQQVPTTPQQPQIQQQQEQQAQGAQTPRAGVEDDMDHDGWMMGWDDGPSWRQGLGWGQGWAGVEGWA